MSKIIHSHNQAQATKYMAHNYLFYSYKISCFILRENLLAEEVLLKC